MTFKEIKLVYWKLHRTNTPPPPYTLFQITVLPSTPPQMLAVVLYQPKQK